MNPLQWQRGHQIAFLVATIFGAGIGIFLALQRIDPAIANYGLHVALWGLAGAALAGLGAFVRQVMRGRNSNRA